MSGEMVIGPAAGSEDGRTPMTAGRAGGLLAIGGTPVVRLARMAGDGRAIHFSVNMVGDMSQDL